LASLGVDYLTKEEVINNKNIKIKLWDTGGQEAYHSISKNYIKRCDGVIIVFDITNKNSFDKMNYWIKLISDNTDSEKNVKQIIIGNKIDLEQERKVKKEEIEKLVSEYNINHFETSAKEDIGIKDAIFSLVNDILKEKEKNNKKQGIKIGKNNKDDEEHSDKNKCCIKV